VKRINYALLVFVTCAAMLALTGCGGGKQVSEVKGLPFDYSNITNGPDMTVDQALDNRKICDSVKWSTSQDDHNRTVVEYDCNYKGIDDSMFVKNGMDVVSAGDVWQWTYGADGKPSLTGVGLVIHRKDGTATTTNYGAIAVSVLSSTIIDNKFTNFDQTYSYLMNKRIPGPPEATKPIRVIPDTTYGNKLAQFFPDQPAVHAAIRAYLQKGLSASAKQFGLDSSGYLAQEDTPETRALAYPVDPSDVQIGFKVDPSIVPEILSHSLNNVAANKIFCFNDYCYDTGAHLVGKASPEVIAKEDSRVNSYSQIMLDNWVAQPELTQQVTLTPSQLETTYGNKLAQLYPGYPPHDAAIRAYVQKGLPANTGTRGLDSLGYLTLFDVPGVRQYLFPVDPSDVQIAVKSEQPNTSTSGIHTPHELQDNKLICLSDLCYDESGNLVGKATSDVVAKEIMEVSIDQFGDIHQVSQTQQTVQAPSQQTMQQAAQQDATAQAAAGGSDDWPAMTPCIQRLEDANAKQAETAGVDSTVTIDQVKEWANTCKTLGQ
jgi:hypothetical protein